MQKLIEIIKQIQNIKNMMGKKTKIYVYTTGLGDKKVEMMFMDKVIPYLDEFKNIDFIIEHYDNEFSKKRHDTNLRGTIHAKPLLNDHNFIEPYIIFNLAGNEIDPVKNPNLFNEKSIYIMYPDKLEINETDKSKRNYGVFYDLGIKPFVIDAHNNIKTYLTQLEDSDYKIVDDTFIIDKKYSKNNNEIVINYKKMIIQGIDINNEKIKSLLKVLTLSPEGYNINRDKIEKELNIKIIYKNIVSNTNANYDMDVNPFTI